MKLSDLFLNRHLFKSTQDEATPDASYSSIAHTDPNESVMSGGSNASFEVNSNPGTVSGDKIRTGAVESTNYAYTIGNTYSTAGTSFDLNNGNIISKQFSIIGGNATFAGTLTAGKIDIPSASATNSFHVDASGNMWIGANASSFASAPFRVTQTGAAVADSLTVNNGTITGGTIQTSATGLRMVMSGTNQAYEFRNGSTLLSNLKSMTIPDSGLSGAALVHGTGEILLGISGQAYGAGSRSLLMQNADASAYLGLFDLDNDVDYPIRCNTTFEFVNDGGGVGKLQIPVGTNLY